MEKKWSKCRLLCCFKLVPLRGKNVWKPRPSGVILVPFRVFFRVYHHASFLVDLEALPSTQDIKCDDVGNWRNNSNDKFYFSVEWMDDNSAQVTAAESSDPDVATLKREYYMLKHDNNFKKRIDILFRK